MTFWPSSILAGMATDAAIPALDDYGVRAGPQGYALAALSCAPAANNRHADGIYSAFGLAMVLNGVFEYRGGGRAVIALPGAVVLANKGEAFGCTHLFPEGNRRIALFYDEGVFHSVADDLALAAPRFAASAAPPSRLTPVIAGLMAQAAQAQDDGGEAALAVLRILLQHAAGRPLDERVPAGEAGRVLEAVRYIESHFTENCSLDTLAAVAGMSRYRFARRFRAVTGETAAQYVIHRRLSAVASRLAATRHKVSQIAYETGFNDLSWFNARFRAAFGCAPNVWRQGRRNARTFRTAPDYPLHR